MTDLPLQKKSPVDFTQEIRFAVVMYGGSSLAIYMNGVAQELLRLVRATAPQRDMSGPLLADDDAKLGGSGQVYRELGQRLSRGDNSLSMPRDKTLRTRFVIDILSGTSAGGINAVFLAKALANDQDMQQLKDLWVETADIDVLINDKQSDKDIGLGMQEPPHSLLNSRRMYYMLLDALDKMETAGDGQASSPYVEELDLYVTATDVRGRKLSLRLADGVARERRHLNTFHFLYRNQEKDSKNQIIQNEDNYFTARYNPFLAFAARCTSAHPVPFEPMKLSDIDEVLIKRNSKLRSDEKDWQPIYEAYLQRDEDQEKGKPAQVDPDKLREMLVKDFQERVFADGGVLDNSPFSFAIDSLQFRRSSLPVDRKLLYIEPVPEHPEEEVDATDKPNALQNGWLSLSALPRYQFIRDDLQRLLDRNRLVERVNRILQGVERDEVERFKYERRKKQRQAEAERLGLTIEAEEKIRGPLSSYEFGQKAMKEMIVLMGSSWGGYQRLRVSETTDDLTRIITRAAGLDEESDEFMAIRYLTRVWRSQNYDANKEGRKGEIDLRGWSPETADPLLDKESENQFLFRYDLNWRLRRLKFVTTKIDEIACFDKRAEEILEIIKELDTGDEPGEEAGGLQLIKKLRIDEMSSFIKKPKIQKEFRKQLRQIKAQLSDSVRELHAVRLNLLSRGENNPLKQVVKELGVSTQRLLEIIEQPTDRDSEARAVEFLQGKAKGKKEDKKEVFQNLVKRLEEELHNRMDEISGRIRGKKAEGQNKGVKGILEVPTLDTSLSDEDFLAPSIEFLARRVLWYYYENFDRYDMISYPILFATNVGDEVDGVEVFRISPEDADCLVTDEGKRRRKLAGTSLGNFGAFFDREARVNDILWGRLDCAERVITALFSSIPASDQREHQDLKRRLIRQAQRAIIAEEYAAAEKAELRGLLAATLAETKTEADNETFEANLRARLGSPTAQRSNMQALLDSCLRGKDPLDHFVETYNYDHKLSAKVLVSSAARASRVFGKMLEGIAETQQLNKNYVLWVTRLTQLFWGLVEVAVPGSVPNLILRHWLKLLYLFEFLLVFGGTLLLNKGIQQFGLLAFGITMAIHAAMLLLGDYMLGPKDEPETAAKKQPFSDEQAEAVDSVLKKKEPPRWWRIFKGLILTGLVLMIVLGIGLSFTLLWADPQGINSTPNIIWDKLNGFRAWVAREDGNGWNRKTLLRFAVVIVVGLFFLWSIRKDLLDLILRRKQTKPAKVRRRRRKSRTASQT
ncbi:MAG TPA: patatin-like protein [Pyrinomonadaceae bacterium]